MQINMGGIMNKVRVYNKSEEGKQRIADYIGGCIKNGRGVTKGGSKIVTLEEMERAADNFIRILRREALQCEPPLPESVRRHFDSIDYTTPIYDKENDSYVIFVFFTDDLHRDSLDQGNYDSGDGIRNIVALFNNGYNASNYVYGYWNGHKAIHESSLHEYSTETDAFVRSKISREGIGFIQQAVDDFNGNYGDMYRVTAIPGNDYSPETFVL